ncbi:DNA mismatch repair protein MutS [Candidatus Marinamargulisbacteria bacterium SCGC AG-410-N11]|nr:DNA mismatch repair protein MutS [Candidatus Marinamargulisbacteria bacterium SCGC AG-410-N11]
MVQPNLDTPMLRQYKAIKAEYEDCILFFRLGDFYEMFLKDAEIAAKELGITLTGRGKDEKRIPMCGIPHHSSENYLTKLIQKGFKVAICEQVEDPSEASGITKREVVKIVTPGTAISDKLLSEEHNNYLSAIMKIPKSSSYGFSFVDISTGEFKILSLANKDDVISLLLKLGSKEILLDTDLDLALPDSIMINPTTFLSEDHSHKLLSDHFKVNSLDSFGLSHLKMVLPAAWAIIDYLKLTQFNTLLQIQSCTELVISDTLRLDNGTIQHLELFKSLHTNQKEGSLFWVLDQTKTALGSRQLQHYLKHPSTNVTTINSRLDAVEELMNDLLSREEIRELLHQVYDLERLISRIVSDHHNPRDCLALKQSFIAIQDLSPILSHFEKSKYLTEFKHFFDSFTIKDSPFSFIIELLETGITDTPPTTIREGGIIKPGFSQELDDLNNSFKSIKSWIQSLESVERNKTGISTLKVGFNKVFGYYFQIPNGQKHNVPSHYIRKQTLTNGERYITPELKEKETILLNGEEEQFALEAKLYKEIVTSIKQHISHIQKCASIIADLDVFQSFATISLKQNYCRPKFVPSESLTLNFVDNRHPVLERIQSTAVIPNTISMNAEDHTFSLITGPNMAGKSTLMKQVGLTVIMAQIGCFTPAKDASLSIIDRLFTRIGAVDYLFSGQSTFMVEMLESSTILHNATSQSLILLDEIGRGTATFDGMSIAGSIVDYIHNTIGARTFFATHYHELTALSHRLQFLKNFNMEIKEISGQLSFTHKYIEGAADKSYGVHVAKMAGLPEPVIEKANELLRGFENQGAHYLEHHPKQLILF